jgi:hypothetical protein
MTWPGERLSIEGHDAFMLQPEGGADEGGRPWVWYAPTLDKHPGAEEVWMFDQFTAKGIAIAGVNVGESYGSPQGVALFTALYEHLTTQYGWAGKPALLARSRGGLMLYNWAAVNGDRVGCIAGIYPVCNLASYPGFDQAAEAYGLTPDALAQRVDEFNPIDRLAPLASSDVPIYHVHGDADEVVPLEANSAIINERYDALGGRMMLEVIPGGGHDVQSFWFENQSLVDFVIENLTA